MELREPIKKRAPFKKYPAPPLPIVTGESAGSLLNAATEVFYVGYYNGQSVVITQPEEINALYSMGFFGKGTFSRGYPAFDKLKQGIPAIIRERQWQRRKEWVQKIEENLNGKNLKPEIEESNSKVSKLIEEIPEELISIDVMRRRKSAESTNDAEKEPCILIDSTEEVSAEETNNDVPPSTSSSVEFDSVNKTKEIVENEIKSDSTVCSSSDIKDMVNKEEKSEAVDSTNIDSQERDEPCSTVKSNDITMQEMSTEGISDKVNSKCALGETEEVLSAGSKINEALICDSNIVVEKLTCGDISSNMIKCDLISLTGLNDVPQISKVNEDFVSSSNGKIISNVSQESEAVLIKNSTNNKDLNESDSLSKESCHNSEDNQCSNDISIKKRKLGIDESMTESPKKLHLGNISESSSVTHEILEDSSEREAPLININIGENNSEEREVLVIADSDTETEERLSNLQPRIEKEVLKPVVEELHLTLEEAFFLSFALGCLEVTDINGCSLSILGMWDIFRANKKDFVNKYVAYHYFRAKGWVVKPGLKYGGDLILYKKGPPFYHASYIVVIEEIDSDYNRIPNNDRKLTWTKIGINNRLAESTNKEVILCQIQKPNVGGNEFKNPLVLTSYRVNEVLIRRWIPAQERDDTN